MRSASRISFAWYSRGLPFIVVSCVTEWSHSRCPAATTAFTRPGWARACVPTMQKVAFTPLSSSTWRICGVHCGSGPSSMVMLTPRGPLSEAWAMSMFTTGAGSAASGTEVCPGIGRGSAEAVGFAGRCAACRPSAVPAWAVHTDASAATPATPNAAASIRPFVPRIPLHPMSAPLPESCCSAFRTCTREDGGWAPVDPAVTEL